MDKEKIEKIKQGLKVCNNGKNCDGCPYDDGGGSCCTCISRLLSDCGELVAELLGVRA